MTKEKRYLQSGISLLVAFSLCCSIPVFASNGKDGSCSAAYSGFTEKLMEIVSDIIPETAPDTTSSELTPIPERVFSHEFFTLATYKDYITEHDLPRETYQSMLACNDYCFFSPFDCDWTSHVSSLFGNRVHPILGGLRMHNGVDIAFPSGTPIHAIWDGTVTLTDTSSSCGLYAVILDADGFQYYYMHCSSLAVEEGDIIEHGDIIGAVGTTGLSTGNHLHMGVKDADGNWLPLSVVTTSLPEEEPVEPLREILHEISE